MVPFAGYSMPLSYGSVGAGELIRCVHYVPCLTPCPFGKVASHHHVRSKVGLFDVGHMVQTKSVNSPLPLIIKTLHSLLDPHNSFRQIPRSNIGRIPRMAHPVFPHLPLTLLIHPLRPAERERRDHRRHGHNKTLRRCFLRRHERGEARPRPRVVCSKDR